jgi:signal transduction histidine kinase
VTLSLALRMARSKLEDGGEAAALLDEASEQLMRALAELRELARGIHPAILTDRGLAAALEALAGRTPVPVELSISVPRNVSDQVEATVYYVVAEALTNTAKYANATGARVTVEGEGRRLTVTVTDDGRGGADRKLGSGLSGLADRVSALGGRLHIISPAGSGTTVIAELPLAPAPEEAAAEGGEPPVTSRSSEAEEAIRSAGRRARRVAQPPGGPA